MRQLDFCKKEDSYFTLAPGERKDIDVTITVPNTLSDKLAAHSAVLYVSQMNPVDDVDSKGANIKVSIRSGIKLFINCLLRIQKNRNPESGI